mmetsp:Transcript_38286/g.97142  ORF Transcript_38286/g.97142 Transcript_38286/m.97142 type:complete len:235 (-) Transcript_38286:76-780(-)
MLGRRHTFEPGHLLNFRNGGSTIALLTRLSSRRISRQLRRHYRNHLRTSGASIRCRGAPTRFCYLVPSDFAQPSQHTLHHHWSCQFVPRWPKYPELRTSPHCSQRCAGSRATGRFAEGGGCVRGLCKGQTFTFSSNKCNPALGGPHANKREQSGTIAASKKSASAVLAEIEPRMVAMPACASPEEPALEAASAETISPAAAGTAAMASAPPPSLASSPDEAEGAEGCREKSVAI